MPVKPLIIIVSYFLFLCLSFCASIVYAQNEELVKIDYSISDLAISNPERGFYTYTESTPTLSHGGSQLGRAALNTIKDSGQTLIIRLYTIGVFRDRDLSPQFLNSIQADFDLLREVGMKAVIRFRYSTSIGEPDAPLSIVLRHLDQLEPFFQNNYDVIAAANGGFIGAWGEWHNSTNNLTTTENMRAILHKFMDVLPERSVMIRYPQAKMAIYNSNQPIQPDEAYTGSYKSRGGHVNDCFLASDTDVGTYRIGSAPFDFEKNYIATDTKYVPMGGETCNPRPDAGTRYHCTTALEELDRLNWSFLNINYSRIIIDHWIDEGCYPEIERRLGYRFELQQGRYSESIKPGGSFHFELDLTNTGFASPYNPRGFQVLLRGFSDADDLWEIYLPVDPRHWQSGDTQNLAFTIGIPEEMPEGMYELLLAMPDPAESLRNRADYSIRLANEGVWESETGFNKLNHLVFIEASAGGDTHSGTLNFVRFGTSTSVDELGQVLPQKIKLYPNFPNPFNPTTTIAFTLDDAQNILLELYTVSGQYVKTIKSGTYSSGTHYAELDASKLSSGVYFYRLITEVGMLTRSMTLLK